MAAKKAEPIAPIIVKKIIVEGHGGHHGGAWKVAYADFVTAMMAFFLLMWLLNASTEKQKKGLADYFSESLIKLKDNSAGSNGVMNGESISGKNNLPKNSNNNIPQPTTRDEDMARFKQLRSAVEKQFERNKALKRLAKNVRFTDTRDGLRIDMVDEADFSMFAYGTDSLTPDALQLLNLVSGVLINLPNPILIRGHTDSAPFPRKSGASNWMLSAARAESTRLFLQRAGVTPGRFARIEGVADREPYVPADKLDPRNRRMSITLGWGSPSRKESKAEPASEKH